MDSPKSVSIKVLNESFLPSYPPHFALFLSHALTMDSCCNSSSNMLVHFLFLMKILPLLCLCGHAHFPLPVAPPPPPHTAHYCWLGISYVQAHVDTHFVIGSGASGAVLSLGPVRIKCNVVCELERTIQLCLLFPQTFGLRDFIAAFKKSVYHSSCSYHWEIIKAWSGSGSVLITVIQKNDKKSNSYWL